MWTDLKFYCFVTIHACDRQTDRILIAIPRLHYMQRGKKGREGREKGRGRKGAGRGYSPYQS